MRKKSLIILLMAILLITTIPKTSFAKTNFTPFNSETGSISDKDLALLSAASYDDLPVVDNPKTVQSVQNQYIRKIESMYGKRLSTFTVNQIIDFAKNYIPVKKISLPSSVTGLTAYIFFSKSNNSFIVSVRGSEIKDPGDLINDITLALTQQTPNQIIPLTSNVDYFFTHLKASKSSGAKNLQNVLKQLSKNYKVDANPEVIFTGHSLGGYLSMLSAMWFMENGRITAPNHIYMTNFNSPGAMNTKFYHDLIGKLFKEKKEQYGKQFRYYISTKYDQAFLSTKKLMYIDFVSGNKLAGTGRYGANNQADVRLVLLNDQVVRKVDQLTNEFKDMFTNGQFKIYTPSNVVDFTLSKDKLSNSCSKLVQLHSIDNLVDSLKYSYSVPSPTSVATVKEKVYPVYFLENLNDKFSQKLTNGLTIKIEKSNGINAPVILKGNKKIWAAELPGSFGFFQYTVTTNNDTFLFCTNIVGGGSGTQIVGVHPDGEVFIQKGYGGTAGSDAKFLSADKIEVAIERVKEGWDPSIDTEADRFTGIWDVNVYSISHTGKINVEKTYVQKNRKTSY